MVALTPTTPRRVNRLNIQQSTCKFMYRILSWRFGLTLEQKKNIQQYGFRIFSFEIQSRFPAWKMKSVGILTLKENM